MLNPTTLYCIVDHEDNICKSNDNCYIFFADRKWAEIHCKGWQNYVDQPLKVIEVKVTEVLPFE